MIVHQETQNYRKESDKKTKMFYFLQTLTEVLGLQITENIPSTSLKIPQLKVLVTCTRTVLKVFGLSGLMGGPKEEPLHFKGGQVCVTVPFRVQKRQENGSYHCR